jgi:cytochrome c-type biogenesis protein
MPIDITYGGSLLGGLVSFLSPCVLPLVPPYLCYMAGVSLGQLTAARDNPVTLRKVVAAAVAFVLGFTTIFVMLGAGASAVGQLLRTHLQLLSLLGGIAIIVMGLHFLGVFRIALLDREARFKPPQQPGPVGSYVMGLAFAFGWTPCIGPILAAILAVAGTEETVVRGASLLAAYSLGLGIPFILAAVFAGPFIRFMARFRGYLGTVEKTMGGLLVLTGVLFITGRIADVSYWLLATFPGLGQIG